MEDNGERKKEGLRKEKEKWKMEERRKRRKKKMVCETSHSRLNT